MPTTMSFQVLNEKAFIEATKLAPKRVRGAVRREFARAGKKFSTQARKELLSGEPGIRLPALQPKRGGRKAIKATQEKHIRMKVSRTGDRGAATFLVIYTSTFLTYHEKKIRQRFEAMFRQAVPGIQARVQKEVVRITQAVMDQQLRDTGIRGVTA